MPRISVVVPVYYNADTLEPLASRLSAAVSALSDDVEFIFVDDGSRDASRGILQELALKDRRIRVLELSRNFGSNAAILAGLTYAKGDCAVVLSADLQDPPELVPALVALWKGDRRNRVVMATRRERQDPLVSRLLADIFNRLFRRFVFRDFPRRGFDFVLLDRQVVDILVAQREKNSFLFGQAIWVGFQRATVAYDRQERTQGRSRWTVSKKVKYFIDAFTAFSYLPLRTMTVAGLLFAAAGFAYAVVIVGLHAAGRVPVTGWASLTVIVLVTSGTQLLMLGVLGEYLWRTLDEVRRRPAFIVESAVNFEPEADPAAHPADRASLNLDVPSL